QLRTWLESTTPLVVDVQVDVDLGALNNVGNRPRTNPELVASGLGVINVRANKTVFSSTGATLRHGMFNISNQSNIIVRNLRFRGLWEFDEGRLRTMMLLWLLMLNMPCRSEIGRAHV